MSELSTIFRSKETQNIIVSAIEKAELNTSGEIRVHLEKKCSANPLSRAFYVFDHLKMQKTAQQNAILIYVAYESKKMAIIGDEGINKVVDKDYWNNIIAQMGNAFSKGLYAEGIADAVLNVGDALKGHFPYQDDDINEQSNEVSYGD